MSLYSQLMLCTSAMHVSIKTRRTERDATRRIMDIVIVLLMNEDCYGVLVNTGNGILDLGFK